MKSETINEVLKIIDDMEIKDKLRLAIRISDSDYTNLKYDKPEMYKRFDNKLKEIDEEYRTKLINFNKYISITFTMAKLMEMSKEEQTQVALYLFNKIKD